MFLVAMFIVYFDYISSIIGLLWAPIYLFNIYGWVVYIM